MNAETIKDCQIALDFLWGLVPRDPLENLEYRHRQDGPGGMIQAIDCLEDVQDELERAQGHLAEADEILEETENKIQYLIDQLEGDEDQPPITPEELDKLRVQVSKALCHVRGEKWKP